MKYLFYLIAVLSIQSHSQTITCTESVVTFPSGTRNAVITTIYWNDRKESVLAWQAYLEKYKYESMTQRGTEIYARNAVFKDILKRPVDIYSLFDENKEEKKIVMTSAIDIGASNYLRSETNPGEFKTFEKIIRDFALLASRTPVNALIQGAADYQVKLAGEIKKLEKEKIKLQKNISEEKKYINESDLKLKNKQTDFEKKEFDCVTQSKKCDTMKKENKNYQSAKNDLEKLQKEKNSLDEERKNMNEDLKKHLQYLADMESQLKKAGEDISDKGREIEKQKAIEEKWTKILASIN